MSQIKTTNAGFTRQSHPTMFRPEDVRAVIVNSRVVGYYARNKYGVTIGTTAVPARNGLNPFLDTSNHVRPAGRTLGRKTADVVRDIGHAA